ncbi:MAG: hypothetical protein JJ863_22270 [Deltaproteobacteria bacterium]|nr:hypothetical protein [Deltaproteobacteria bacterium]
MRFLLLSSLLLALACGDDDGTVDPDLGTGMDAGPAGPSLRDAPVTFATVYEATRYTQGGYDRAYLPMDVAAHPNGQLWVVQQMERDGSFDENTECTQRGLSGDPDDCVSLQGTTVAITDPAAVEPATEANGRVRIVMDANAWHFMRRPAAIAFGATELTLDPSDPGAAETGITEPLVLRDTFATCHEHWTGNPTDMPPFIGPTLWTSDPTIYDGTNGSFSWSNGSHLDMVHATQYCMGIAYESENVYWTFNGQYGLIDRYDFGAPHHPGHYDHDDGTVTRYLLPVGDEMARVENVPSNMVIADRQLWIADTGNGRVLRFDLDSPATRFGTFTSYEGYAGDTMEGMGYTPVLDRAALEAEWGGAAEPSGLTVLADGSVLVANHATGHLTLLESDGTIVRTIDTETGAGIGGLTTVGDTVYFVQMDQRRIVRIDLAE